MVMGSALIQGFVQHLPLCSVRSPSINFVALEAAPQAGKWLKYLLQKTSLIFNLKHICKEENSQFSQRVRSRQGGSLGRSKRLKPANRKLGEERREQGKHRNQSGTSNLEFGIPTEVAVWMNRSSKCMRNGEQVSRRLGQRPTDKSSPRQAGPARTIAWCVWLWWTGNGGTDRPEWTETGFMFHSVSPEMSDWPMKSRRDVFLKSLYNDSCRPLLSV